MTSNDTAAAEREERLKSALWYTIGTYIDNSTISSHLNATPQFTGALTELIYTQIANTARDLETFANHAGRKVIGVDDVMLLTRRNDALEVMLRQELERIRAAEGRTADGAPEGANIGTGKKRGRPAGKGKGKAAK
ncbi:MHF histone-fold complex component [Neocucurbitaria cava]|uniref:MHF histone-fold complex component n=1 Tax=Neocucurbitaria cava TaxID=798079 RepID=A0A9W9CLF3_9PLEO|nr:MHF histone-fold complex component [Neocucurbitaria cava]